MTLRLDGDPSEVGLCHCRTCRRETGGPFMAYAVFPRAALTVVGETRSWIETTDHRHFCPRCGSPLFATMDGDPAVEMRLGCLDDTSDLTPAFEIWVDRRAPWLAPLPGAAQHKRNLP
ncbi:GFA family protein [Acuticoccus sp. I52.16.1]|uniref:GFA family protein n=1 Tax=Acuticoccus sp. I52.16.1 TaxID=2928472 RepID=UPI001FCF8C34|nr:GFA family protein [Acuticoccus sp. I52.16.1]UOM34632.1 GFA family protein [Acuticoccus sp. I52.16.1]